MKRKLINLVSLSLDTDKGLHLKLLDPNKCRKESCEIAKQFQLLRDSGMDDALFDQYYERCQQSFLTAKAIEEIEVTVTLSDGKYRPIDVHKFDVKH